MHVDKASLLSAAAKIGITKSQAEALWTVLAARREGSPSGRFDFAHVLYYLGAMIVIVAMGWALGITWERFGGGGMMTIAIVYAVLFLLIGHGLWHRAHLRVPGGLFITLAVCMVPLAIYGFQRITGAWTEADPGQYRDFFVWIKSGWFPMEVGTIIAGVVALYFYRFPFLTAPIYFSLWFMSMDLTALIYGDNEFLWSQRLWVSLWFGLAILIIAYIVDQRTREDYAFWGYLFGLFAFWFGLGLLMDLEDVLVRFLYCLFNLFLMFLSVLLQRRVFLIFGAFGVLGYIVSIFFEYFSESTLFPIFLSFIGILVIFIGVLYAKNQATIERSVHNALPQWAIKLLPRHRREL